MRNESEGVKNGKFGKPKSDRKVSERLFSMIILIEILAAVPQLQ